MKKLKHWEEERRVLQEGLDTAQQAHRWYQARMAAVQERIRYGPEGGSPNVHTEAQQVLFSHFYSIIRAHVLILET